MSSLEHRREMPRRQFDHTKRTPLLGWAIVCLTAVCMLWAIGSLIAELG